jgi:hypothetical protein
VSRGTGAEILFSVLGILAVARRGKVALALNKYSLHAGTFPTKQLFACRVSTNEHRR